MSRTPFSGSARVRAKKRLYVTGAVCHICDQKLDLTLVGLDLPDSPTINHIVPRWRGGLNVASTSLLHTSAATNGREVGPLSN